MEDHNDFKGPVSSDAVVVNMAVLSEKSVAVFKAHRDEVRDNFKFVWGQYMTWFCFFCTFNLTALGVVHIAGAGKGFSPLVVAFLSISVLGSGSSVYMRFYSIRVLKILRDLDAQIRCNTISVDEQDRVGREIKDTFPPALTVWASIVNFLAIVIFICIWLLIYFHGATPPNK